MRCPHARRCTTDHRVVYLSSCPAPLALRKISKELIEVLSSARIPRIRAAVVTFGVFLVSTEPTRHDNKGLPFQGQHGALHQNWTDLSDSSSLRRLLWYHLMTVTAATCRGPSPWVSWMSTWAPLSRTRQERKCGCRQQVPSAWIRISGRVTCTIDSREFLDLLKTRGYLALLLIMDSWVRLAMFPLLIMGLL